MKSETPQMDWQQVILNGGPPCFHVEGPQYCGRAERWEGHGNKAFHDYVSLDDLLNAERERCAKIAEDPANISMVGGSTGDAYGTAKQIAAAIRGNTNAD